MNIGGYIKLAFHEAVRNKDIMASLFPMGRHKKNRTMCRSEALLLAIFLLLDQSCGTMFPSQLHLDPNTRGLRDLTVVVGEGLEGSCKEVVDSVRRAVTSASRSLHADLQGKLKVDTVRVQVIKVHGDIVPVWKWRLSADLSFEKLLKIA